MPFSKETWANGPGGGTPLSASRLNSLETRIEAGIDLADSGIATVIVHPRFGDNSTDARAAVQDAVDEAAATITSTGKGAVVVLPPGTFRFSSGVDAGVGAGSTAGVALPYGLGSRLTIRGSGRGVTTIRLSSSCINAFWLDRDADFDTFRNICLEDFDVDCNSAGTSGVTGKAHVLIGSIPGNNTQQSRLNFADITIRRIRGYNLPEDFSGSSAARRFIALIGNNTSTTTGTSTLDVLVEDVETLGGASCVEVTCYGAGTVGHNHYYDNVHYRRLRHVVSSPPTQFGNSTSFYICGTGYGDRCSFVDGYSENSSDNIFEVGMMRYVVVERVRAKNSYLAGFTLRHTHNPATYGTTWDPFEQEISFRKCGLVVTQAANTAATTGAGHKFSVFIQDAGAGAWGTVKMEDVYYETTGAAYSRDGAANPFFSTETVPVQRVEIIRPRIRVKNYTADGAAPTLRMMSFASTTAGAQAVLRDAAVKIDGMSVSSSVSFGPAIVYCAGNDHVHDIDGLDVDWNGWAAAPNGGAAKIVDLTGATAVRGSIRRVRPKTSTFSGASLRSIDFNGGTIDPGGFVVEACDFSKVQSSTEDVRAGTAANAQRLRIRDIRNQVLVPSVETVGLGASPAVYTPSRGYDEEVEITGGTVSLIERSNNLSTYTDTGRTSGVFAVRAGQALRVTYTVAPTVRRSPLT